VNPATLRPAFIGLGNIGKPIADNLGQAFPNMLAYDAAGTEARLPRNARVATGVADLAGGATHIFLSRPARSF
jgi:3-hydroxyisobutyrate dehydrogenase-like beta-hydroxyacid dehydrogenase